MLISAWSLAAFLAFFPFFFGKIYEYKVFIPTCYYEESKLFYSLFNNLYGTVAVYRPYIGRIVAVYRPYMGRIAWPN